MRKMPIIEPGDEADRKTKDINRGKCALVMV